jgi:hypothetical protein
LNFYEFWRVSDLFEIIQTKSLGKKKKWHYAFESTVAHGQNGATGVKLARVS